MPGPTGHFASTATRAEPVPYQGRFPGYEIHKIDKGTDIATVRVISEVVIFGKRLERLNHLFVGIVTGHCARGSRVPQPTSKVLTVEVVDCRFFGSDL
jgi:hypothetical protein